MKPNLLVLCTGNSCRSQIAEGYFRTFGGERLNVFSAGTDPKEEVHPLAVKVTAEDGVDISKQRPKHLKDYLGLLPVRHLVVVCGGANENCPRIWPGMHERLYWPFDDPAAYAGSPEDTLNEFRRVRDEIKTKIQSWLEAEGKDQQ